MAGVEGRVAIVTGAGSPNGIGFAAARALAAEGASVMVTSTTKRIMNRARELGKAHAGFIADLTREEDAEALVRETVKKFRRIDILVNNAGMIQTGKRVTSTRVDLLSAKDWAKHLELNVTTAFFMTRAVVPYMKRRKHGRIVNVSSVTGPVVSNPRSAGYSSGKAAMTGLTRATALETARLGITCNAVLPGWIASGSQTPPEVKAGKATPAGRSGTPEEVAACILFLASEEASYVTGAMLVVDGANAIAEYKGAPDDWY